MAPKPFLKNRYRVKLSDTSDADHWSGGKPAHRGAVCPACKIPFLLLWDINCQDPRFPKDAFGPLKRLPLYFCWGCVNDVGYQIVGEDLRLHLHPRGNAPSFQYEPYPAQMPRRGLLLLEGVSNQVREAVADCDSRWDAVMNGGDDDAGLPMPTPEQKAVLKDFYGHPVTAPMTFFHHQFGGVPIKGGWAQEVFSCPNPDCHGGTLDRLRGRRSAMKFLAGVLNDPHAGLTMVEAATDETKTSWNYHVSVQFHMCDRCWTIFGCNRGE